MNRCVYDIVIAKNAICFFLGAPNREAIFKDKAKLLQDFSTRASKTARLVAAGGSSNKKLAQALVTSANQVRPHYLCC